MTTLTLQDNIKLSKTSFINIKDLYDFIIENQIITEIGTVDENSLSEKSKTLFKKSKISSNLINI
ncbi:hypothetical protein KAZ01_01335 [Candidatus Gracilibacteria bacterium]|nr:hypothetical protein [Candidatus Gracilibacteria bacterium]